MDALDLESVDIAAATIDDVECVLLGRAWTTRYAIGCDGIAPDLDDQLLALPRFWRVAARCCRTSQSAQASL